MTTDVFTTKPTEEVVFAFEKLMTNKISAMPVIEEDKMVGIVTATDLGHNLILDNYQLGTTVADVMVKDVAFVKPEDGLIDAICLMEEKASGPDIINQLPVIDDDKLVGILSDGDIIRAIKKEL
jgi:CBS domain-containing protein